MTVTLEVTDDCDNTSTCEAVLIVLDTVMVEMTPPENDTFPCLTDIDPVFATVDDYEIDGGGTLIDLDMLALGPPAVDVATIISHLHLRHLKGAVLPWREIAGDIVEASGERIGRHQLHRWVVGTSRSQIRGDSAR